MTPADSRVWKADGEISRSKKSETHHLPKGQGESQARGRSPMRLKGQEWRQQLLWKAGWRQHGTVKPRERMLGLTAGLQCTAPPLSHPPRKAPVHGGGGGDTRHRRLGYKQSQTESNKIHPEVYGTLGPLLSSATGNVTWFCILHRHGGLGTGAASSKKVAGPRSALWVLVVQNTPLKCLVLHQSLYPEAHLSNYFYMLFLQRLVTCSDTIRKLYKVKRENIPTFI